MSIVVQKFGGSSVAEVEKIRQVALKVKARRDEGFELVVVVSAMGDTTDELLALAKKISPDPPRRELDMLLTCGERISMALLSMALHEIGVPAISFTGSQSGIITNDTHSQARIVEVRPYRIQEELAKGKVVIVAGYQGVSPRREVTTLGRGGSDTTAVALAAALGADCEIYSDVDGVFSADPRVVADARKLPELSYEEMQALACAGAQVLNARALPPPPVVMVKGITAEAQMVTLGAEGSGRALVELLGFLDQWGVAGRVLSFDALGAPAGLVFVAVPLQDLHGLEALKLELATRFGGRVVLREGLGTVTCVGVGLNADWSHLRRALAAAEGISAPVWAVHTSPLQLSLLVAQTQLDALTRRLHQEFVSG
jgi:aspartate kinase